MARVEAIVSSENSKSMTLQQKARQKSEQQLDELLQQQCEINKQQRGGLLELREFREKYERLNNSRNKGEVELGRTGLAGIKFPTNKQNLQTYVEQNRAKIGDDADSVAIAIGKLPSKEYANIQRV